MPESRIVESLRDEFRNLSIETAKLGVEIQSFKETIKSFFKIIHGDGTNQSLITQMVLNTREIKELKDEVAEKLKNYSHEKVMLWSGLITGILGLIGAGITGIFHWIKP